MKNQTVFIWKYNRGAPLAEIVKAARKKPSLNPYRVRDGSCDDIMVLARSAKAAQKRYVELTGCYVYLSDVEEWLDEG